MKPTQKQPEPLKNVAVTREEVEEKAYYGARGWKSVPQSLAFRLLTERDEAIREVEKFKRWWKDSVTGNGEALEAEKRLTAALAEAADAYLDAGGIKRDEEERHSPQRAALVRVIGESKLNAPNMKPIPHPDHVRCLEVYAKQSSALFVEKKLAAVYREVAISKLRFAMFGNQELSADVEQSLEGQIDAEAQKLLAPSDSGGEKK